jgi:hypothetical protein
VTVLYTVARLQELGQLGHWQLFKSHESWSVTTRCFCLHCERWFAFGAMVRDPEDGLLMCPWWGEQDCNGSLIDAWPHDLSGLDETGATVHGEDLEA